LNDENEIATATFPYCKKAATHTEVVQYMQPTSLLYPNAMPPDTSGNIRHRYRAPRTAPKQLIYLSQRDGRRTWPNTASLYKKSASSKAVHSLKSFAILLTSQLAAVHLQRAVSLSFPLIHDFIQCYNRGHRLVEVMASAMAAVP
jgi:hypothetical protein